MAEVDEVNSQFEKARRLCEHLAPIYSKEGYEADDII
jgi:hypothetical protein